MFWPGDGLLKLKLSSKKASLTLGNRVTTLPVRVTMFPAHLNEILLGVRITLRKQFRLLLGIKLAGISCITKIAKNSLVTKTVKTVHCSCISICIILWQCLMI